jgi:hypothetical protein
MKFRLQNIVNRLVKLTGATTQDAYFDKLEETAADYDHQKQVFQTIENLKELDLIDDELAQQAGDRIIQLFGLKPNADGRYDLHGGDKTAKGLARTVVRCLYDDTFFDE